MFKHDKQSSISNIITVDSVFLFKQYFSILWGFVISVLKSGSNKIYIHVYQKRNLIQTHSIIRSNRMRMLHFKHIRKIKTRLVQTEYYFSAWKFSSNRISTQGVGTDISVLKQPQSARTDRINVITQYRVLVQLMQYQPFSPHKN